MNKIRPARQCGVAAMCPRFEFAVGRDRREMLPVSVPDRLTTHRRLDSGSRTSDPHKESYHPPLAGQASRGQRLSLLASGFRSGS